MRIDGRTESAHRNCPAKAESGRVGFSSLATEAPLVGAFLLPAHQLPAAYAAGGGGGGGFGGLGGGFGGGIGRLILKRRETSTRRAD
jgi:hypothetical protein